MCAKRKLLRDHIFLSGEGRKKVDVLRRRGAVRGKKKARSPPRKGEARRKGSEKKAFYQNGTRGTQMASKKKKRGSS